MEQDVTSIQHSFDSPISRERHINWAKVVGVVIGSVLFLTIGVVFGAQYFGQQKNNNQLPIENTPSQHQISTSPEEQLLPTSQCISNEDCQDQCQECRNGVCKELAFCNPQQPLLCTSDADCPRNNASTGYSCVEGICVLDRKHQESIGCLSDAECPTVGVCTDQKCPIGRCIDRECVVYNKTNLECNSYTDCPITHEECFPKECRPPMCIGGLCAYED